MSIDREQPIEVQREIANEEVKRVLKQAIDSLKQIIANGKESINIIGAWGNIRKLDLDVKDLDLTDAELKEAGNSGNYEKSFQFIKLDEQLPGGEYEGNYYIGAKFDEKSGGIKYAFSEVGKNGKVNSDLKYPEHNKKDEVDEIDKELLASVPDSLRHFQRLLEEFIKGYKKR